MRWLASALALAGVVAGLFLWRQDRHAPVTFSARTVVQPQRREIDAEVQATGTIRLKVGAEVRVGAMISGIVKKLNVGVGSYVRKGDVIAEIDPRSLQAQVAQAQAQTQADEVALAQAQFNRNRTRRLLADGLIPPQQDDDAMWVVKNAKAKLDRSRSDLALVEVNLGYATIRAPISGMVASVSTEEGETVASSFTTPTFVTIVADNALELVAMVDEADIGNVRRGDPVVFTVEAFSSIERNGRVERINPTGTLISGVVNYEVVVGLRAAAARGLKPDMTADVAIRTARREALVIPDAAVHRDGDAHFIYLYRDGDFEQRNVSIGIRRNGWTEIRSGARSEDHVLVGDLPTKAEKGGKSWWSWIE